MLEHHWPTTTNRVIQPNILERLYFGNYINYHICLSFKTLLLLSCPFGDFAPKSSLLASPSPPIIEGHLTFPTNPYPFSFLASLGTFLGRSWIRLFTQLRALFSSLPENFTRAADGRDPVILNTSSISRFLQANQTLWSSSSPHPPQHKL